MTPVSAWLLLTVVWQGGMEPSIAVYPQANIAVCHKAAASFIGAEEFLKADELPSELDQYDVRCILAHDSETEEG